jgi:hypothetical protein
MNITRSAKLGIAAGVAGVAIAVTPAIGNAVTSSSPAPTPQAYLTAHGYTPLMQMTHAQIVSAMNAQASDGYVTTAAVGTHGGDAEIVIGLTPDGVALTHDTTSSGLRAALTQAVSDTPGAHASLDGAYLVVTVPTN